MHVVPRVIFACCVCTLLYTCVGADEQECYVYNGFKCCKLLLEKSSAKYREGNWTESLWECKLCLKKTCDLVQYYRRIEICAHLATERQSLSPICTVKWFPINSIQNENKPRPSKTLSDNIVLPFSSLHSFQFPLNGNWNSRNPFGSVREQSEVTRSFLYLFRNYPFVNEDDSILSNSEANFDNEISFIKDRNQEKKTDIKEDSSSLRRQKSFSHIPSELKRKPENFVHNERSNLDLGLPWTPSSIDNSTALPLQHILNDDVKRIPLFSKWNSSLIIWCALGASVFLIFLIILLLFIGFRNPNKKKEYYEKSWDIQDDSSQYGPEELDADLALQYV